MRKATDMARKSTTDKPTDTNTDTTTEIAKPEWTNEQLRNLQSWEDAAAFINAEFGGALDAAQELGDGFTLYDSKRDLCGVPLVFLNWEFRESDKFTKVVNDEIVNGTFVSARVMAAMPQGMRKLIINDGSTGLHDQLRELTQRTGRQGGLVAKRGLRASDYDYVEADGTKSEATTYYIDTSDE